MAENEQTGTVARDPRRADAAAVVFAACFPAVATFVYSVLLVDFPPAIRGSVYVLEQLVQITFPVFWVVVVRRRKLRIAKPHGRGLAAGLLFGGLVTGLMFAVYWLWLKPAGLFDGPDTHITEQVHGLGLGSPLKFILFGVFVVTFHSFMEEYYWRWFVFGELRRFVSLNAAIVISSLAFMSFHVVHLGVFFGWASPATWIFAAGVAIGGAFWAWNYHRSQALYGPWLSHLLVDVAIYVIAYDLIRDHLI